MTSFRGTGWAHPVAAAAGRLEEVSERPAIERSIELILGTAKGERLMRPDFGSGLHDFVFKPLSATNRARMATAVKQALQAWEPRIRVLDVTVRVTPQEPARALISIDYEIRRSNTQANLVYPFYVRTAV